MKKLFGVDVGLLILVIGSALSFYLGTFVLFRFANGLADELGIEGANAYLRYMLKIFFFMILPPFLGLVFSLIAYIREMKSPTGILEAYWLPLVAFGVAFLLWGANEVRFTYHTLPYDIDTAINYYHSPQVASFVSDIHMAVLASAFLWISAGITLMASPILNVIRWLKRKSQK